MSVLESERKGRREGGRKARRGLAVAAKASLSLALLAWVIRRAGIPEVGEAMRSADIRLIFLAFSLHFVGYLLIVYRWRTLLAAQTIAARIGYLFRSVLVGIFFNNFLPSTMGGDAVRAYDTCRLGATPSVAIATIFVDRFLGLVALLGFALVGLFITTGTAPPLPNLGIWMAALAAAALILVWLVFAPNERRLQRPPPAIVAKLLSGFASFRGRGDALSAAFALSVLLQVNVVIYYFLIGTALGFPVPLGEYFLVIPLALFIMMVPVSINAIGVREGVFVFFFGLYGIAAADALAFAWLVYGMVLVQGVMGASVYVLRQRAIPTQRPVSSPVTALHRAN